MPIGLDQHSWNVTMLSDMPSALRLVLKGLGSCDLVLKYLLGTICFPNTFGCCSVPNASWVFAPVNELDRAEADSD